jgi:hypothetical protein
VEFASNFFLIKFFDGSKVKNMKSDWLQNEPSIILGIVRIKQPKYLLTVILAISLCFLMGCEKNDAASTSASNTVNQAEGQFDQEAYQKAKDEALADAEKALEARKRGAPMPPSQFRFPNTPEPEQGIPDYLNFYRINDHYPTYLLCQYDVDKKEYNQSVEARWFKTSLEQVRQSGPAKFPPIKWIAVIIVNGAEWQGASTYEQAHKVGAIFKASDVFNPSCDLSQLVAHADMNRHPFQYDTSQPTPGDQDRWLIVEQHAATNQTNTVSN